MQFLLSMYKHKCELVELKLGSNILIITIFELVAFMIKRVVFLVLIRDRKMKAMNKCGALPT